MLGIVLSSSVISLIVCTVVSSFHSDLSFIFVFNSLPCLITSWFTQWIPCCAPGYRRGDFIIPHCMYHIGTTFYAFANSSMEKFPGLWLKHCSECIVSRERSMPVVSWILLDTLERCRIFDYGSCPCSKVRYRSLNSSILVFRGNQFLVTSTVFLSQLAGADSILKRLHLVVFCQRNPTMRSWLSLIICNEAFLFRRNFFSWCLPNMLSVPRRPRPLVGYSSYDGFCLKTSLKTVSLS